MTPLQFGNLAAGSPEIQRTNVNQRFLDRNDEQRALDDFRALLVPQRDLRRDDLILADARSHLPRTEDDGLLWKLKGDQLAVVLAVAPRNHPRGKVVFLPRREGQHLDVLRSYPPGSFMIV